MGTHACWPYTPLYTIATKSRTYPPRCHIAFFLIGMRQGYSRYGMEDGVVCETTKVTMEPSNQATKVNSPSRLGKFGREKFYTSKKSIFVTFNFLHVCTSLPPTIDPSRGKITHIRLLGHCLSREKKLRTHHHIYRGSSTSVKITCLRL